MLSDQGANSSSPIDRSNSSVIISSRNRPEMLTQVVVSVLQGKQLPAEIIIVDQSEVEHPTLPALQAVLECEIRYLWTNSVGLSRGRNEGIAAATQPIVVFTDDDIVVAPDWLENITRPLAEHGPRTVVTGQVLAGETNVAGGFAPSVKLDTLPQVYQGRVGKGVLAGGNLALYRAAFDEVGYFDEYLGAGSAFPSSEDNDLSYRLLEAGYRIMYEPQAVLYHLAWRPADQFLKMRWNYGVGRGACYAKHLSLKDPYMLRCLLVDLGRHFYNAACLVRQQRQQAYGNLVFNLALVSGAARWLLVQPNKKVPG